MSAEPSAAAAVIADLVPVLDAQTCRELRALLADEIATSDTLAPAHHSLVGIVALLAALERVPSIDDYEQARRTHSGWPHHSALVRAYGSWLVAVSAAVKMMSKQPRPPGPRRRADRFRHSKMDCINAVRRCVLAIGDDPTAREYQRWQIIEADLYRRTGALARTPPTLKVVENRLGRWHNALSAVRVVDGTRPG